MWLRENELQYVEKELYMFARHFAQWGAEHSGSSEIPIKAVAGRIYDFRRIKEIGYSSAKIEFEEIPELDDGDKVRVIVIKEN